MLLPEQILNERNSVWDVAAFVKRKDTGGLFAASNATYWKMFQRKSSKKKGKGKICSVKHSYHTYILQAISQKVDCYHQPSQNSPSHLHIITLIEHVLDNNDAGNCCQDSWFLSY